MARAADHDEDNRRQRFCRGWRCSVETRARVAEGVGESGGGASDWGVSDARAVASAVASGPASEGRIAKRLRSVLQTGSSATVQECKRNERRDERGTKDEGLRLAEVGVEDGAGASRWNFPIQPMSARILFLALG